MTPQQLESLVLTDKVFHCALDDTIDILEEINKKADTLKSIFEVEVLALLKQFHDQYGATFSLYLFYELLDGFCLTQMTDKFKDEWQANSDWLKLSFHSRTRLPINVDYRVDYYLYFDKDYETAKKDFMDIKREILRFAGEEVWDNYPRTHFWSGNKETVKAWRDCGVGGLFFSYPGYPAMYFNDEELKQMWEKDFWYDRELDMLYIATNLKAPCMTVADVEKDLSMVNDRKIAEIFADDYNVVELKEQMETAIKWAVQNGYKPVFYESIFDN